MRVIYILILFLSFSCFSQNAGGSAVVEYQCIYNTDLPNTLFATLFIDGSTTIYLEKRSTITYDPKATADGSRIVGPDVVLDTYMKYNHIKRQLFFYDTFIHTIALIEDNYIKPQWRITDETKDIAGYSCLKATTTFRGREWEAWFAPDIPLPYGPWKLHGLPGLIMEVNDITSNMYIIRAVKIEFKRDSVFDKDFSILTKTDNKEPMPYRQYIEDTQEYLDNTGRRLQMEMQGFHNSPQQRGGKELKFEWE